MVDTTAFGEESVVRARGMGGRWWQAAVAAAIAIVSGGLFSWYSLLNPLAQTMKAYAHQRFRPVQARLSEFPYVEANRMRGGGGEGEIDQAESELELAAAAVLERRGEDPKTLHAKGVALLVIAKDHTGKDAAAEIMEDRNKAVEMLQAAAAHAPKNAKYESDLATALIETGTRANFERAVKVCDQALQIDSRSADALFNRAIALDLLGRRPEAVTAYERYLAVDSFSPWATEAKKALENLR
ncbi:MAG TPA: tetratricopeptide repeat protein [Thermoanaerobaculia bacterium]|nr:tetratricopeptide repeat protein [Thermoanaerobaculia bacterium]